MDFTILIKFDPTGGTLILNINGQKKEIHSSTTLADLVRELEIVSPHFAVALNQEIVPSKELNRTKICEGDSIEIVHAVGGGL